VPAQGRFAGISARDLINSCGSTAQGLSVRVAVQHEAYHRVGSSTVLARNQFRRQIGTELIGLCGSSTVPAMGSGV